jgi:hypothetical protein
MRVLALCKPAAGVDPAITFPPHLAAERAALARLRDTGTLVEAYTPSGPGAVLILEVSDLDQAESDLAELPLKMAGLLDIELIPLHPVKLDPSV